MGILSSLKGLFSGATDAPEQVEETIDYKGYQIIPSPMKENGQYRVAATIIKGEGDAQQTHRFIRSDLIPNRDECLEITLRKTKLSIDQLGDNLFH